MDKCSLSLVDLTKRAVDEEGKKIRARGARLLTDNLRTIEEGLEGLTMHR
jgi:hypothetical protein